LRIRQRELDVARGRVAEKRREKAREQREQASQLKTLDDTSRQLHARLSSGASANLLRAAGAAMDVAHTKASRAGQRAQAQNAVIEDALSALTESRKRARSLEILESKWIERERRESARRDQKRLDEIASSRAAERVSS